MKVWQYASYEEYVAAQTEANKRKLHNVWVRPETIARIVAQAAPSRVESILCHGTRNGAEQRLFKQHYPRAFVIGTEISETSINFEYTVHHDFHEPRSDWVANFDIVYSNSWDHAILPEFALTTWRDQLSDCGRLIIEHPTVTVSNASDPVEIEAHEIPGILLAAGLKVLQEFSARGIKDTNEHPSTVYVTERA